MNNENTEITIRLSDLCAAFLRAFKPILLFVLILSLLGALYGARGPRETQTTSSVEQIREAEAALVDAERARDDAQKTLDRILEIEIPTAEREIEHRESLARGWREYMDNSILHKQINTPYQAFSKVGSIVMYYNNVFFHFYQFLSHSAFCRLSFISSLSVLYFLAASVVSAPSIASWEL